MSLKGIFPNPKIRRSMDDFRRNMANSIIIASKLKFMKPNDIISRTMNRH
jgi:hypothetical protein